MKFLKVVGAKLFFEVEVDGQDDSEDPTTDIVPYILEPRQRILVVMPEASTEEQFKA